MTLSAGSRLGPYEIVSAVGAGGMGEVYKARDIRLERTVAVKVLPPHLSESADFRQRFEREAKTISQLSHPHICALHDVGNQDGVEYLVMEFLEGETLTERLARGPLPTQQVLRYGIEIADALDKAHRQGIVHRDLKTGNVMITKSGVKLVDFGLAKAAAPPTASIYSSLSVLPTQAGENLTAEGTILGTFQYMAPEQLEGKEADARTDIFALGLVLYEMATGKKAFVGKSQASLIAAILEHDPPPISAVQPLAPPALDRVVKTCLAKGPDDRWQTAHDVMLELRWIVEAGSQAGVPAPVAAKRKSRERLAWIAFTVAAATAAVFAVAYARRVPSPPQLFRSSILLPDGVSFGTLAIAPDGRSLAWIGSDTRGKSSIWIRPLSTGDTQPLPGTEGAQNLFWSPDGRAVGFFADGKLKRIDVAGGPSIVVCDADGIAGSWNRDGIILLSLPSGPILRVPASGGAPISVTKLDASRHETTHRYPVFLPDGRHFLFLAANLAGAPGDPANSVKVGSLDSSSGAVVTATEFIAAYASGHLLFVREGTLLAQRFDPKTFRLSGDPRPVAERVSGYQVLWGAQNFSVSTNGVLVYQEALPRLSQLVWFDREGHRLQTFGNPGAYVDPHISPDGGKVAIAIRDPDRRRTDLWVFDLKRGVNVRLSSGTSGTGQAPTSSPAWSGDGSRIAFSDNRRHQGDVYVRSIGGSGGEEPLVEAEGQKLPQDWSSDGRYLLYEDREPRGARNVTVRILPLIGERRPISFYRRGTEFGADRFSPDGKWIAFSADDSGRSEIYVAPFEDSRNRVQISSGGGDHPRWRRDGKELFYVAPDGKIMAVAVSAPKDLHNFDAGPARPLFDTELTGSMVPMYDVAPDGRFLVVSRVAGSAPPPITLLVNWMAGEKR
ncbi:MAG TPA: protein kinase [Thermoanaerobaculia bacterium]|nr:protein kinase [Thermoanaerobaculia bacterium]